MHALEVKPRTRMRRTPAELLLAIHPSRDAKKRGLGSKETEASLTKSTDDPIT
jgi:hypothetical protein